MQLGRARITLTTTRRQLDATGEWILRFTPRLDPGVLGSGSLTLPFWECGETDSDEIIARTQARALASARQSLRAILEDVDPAPAPVGFTPEHIAMALDAAATSLSDLRAGNPGAELHEPITATIDRARALSRSLRA
jgi:hypothetical protein